MFIKSEYGAVRGWRRESMEVNEFLFEKMKKFWKWIVMWLHNTVFSVPPNWTLHTD